MAESEDLINFDVIEGHKENIQALPSGRSAKKLAALFSPRGPLQQVPTPTDTRNANDAARMQFEAEIANIDESDDPLDVYHRYVRWTLDAYPSAQATPESGLRPLLERATKAFVGSAQYRNDPRYIRLWVHYISLFSDAPREAYVFLSRHAIGENLALFYEEYAAWLEGAGRWGQAEEIYRLGIERDAHPAARLVRKFGEFEQRRAQQQPSDDRTAAAGPSSPALPAVRPVLAAKVDPFALGAAPTESQPQRQTSGARGAAAAGKPGKAKMAIFSDADAPVAAPAAGSRGPESQGWDCIGSVADRKKENTVEARPWEGETLKAGGKKPSGPKMAIFKDTSRLQPVKKTRPQLPSVVVHPSQHQVTVHPQTGKKERVFVDLVTIYSTPDEPGTERSFEEIWAMTRGWTEVDWDAIDAEEEEEARRQGPGEEPEEEEEDTPMDMDMDDDDVDMDLGSADHHSESTPISPDPLQATPPQPMQKLVVRQDTIRIDDHVNLAPKPPKTDNLAIRRDSPRQEQQRRRAPMQPRPQPAPQIISIRQDEDGLLLDENGAVMEKPRESRPRKMKVMEVNETQIIKAKLDSPPKPKMKKRNAPAEPTMTMHTKAATDDIYEIFNQPLKPGGYVEQEDTESVYETDYETEGDCTSVADSEGTIPHVLGSEAGDEIDDDDAKSVGSGWSDFATRKDIPDLSHDGAGPENDYDVSGAFTEPTGRTEVHEGGGGEKDGWREDGEEEEEHPDSPPRMRTIFIPVPPEDYEAPTRPYRDAAEKANNRLPFMTPITERTESSLDFEASRRRIASYRTPSRVDGYDGDDADGPDSPLSSVDEDLIALEQMSSPMVPPRAESPSPFKRKLPLMPKYVTAAGASPPSRSAPLIQDAQCNPVHDNVQAEILARMDPPLATYHGFFDRRDELYGGGGEIRKYAKAFVKAKAGGATASSLQPVVIRLPDAKGAYTVKKELGAGAFAPVYLIHNSSADTDVDANMMNLGSNPEEKRRRNVVEALKMESPPSAWEFHMMRLVHRRLGPGHRAAESISVAHELHLYRDEAFLVLQYHPHGTVLDVVNLFRAEPSGVMDEALAMFFTVELLRTVGALHAHGLLHGDLKADNCMLRLGGDCATASLPPLGSRYRADGSDGWSSRGLALIDFGRAISMHDFLPEVRFVADWKPTIQDCAEMREGRPWTWQIDYHGLAGIVHCLLFGRYMETTTTRVATDDDNDGATTTKRYRIREGLKRYWQTDLWAACFDVLLNPGAHVAGEEGARMPVQCALGRVRRGMEEWLEENCERGVGLKALVAKVEGAVMKGRQR